MKEKHRKPKPFVGVQFACCNVYTRIYLNADASAYEGRCPKCANRVRLKVGEGGSRARFWRAE